MKLPVRHKLAIFFKKFHLKEIFSILFILAAIYFLRQQRDELKAIIPALRSADTFWVAIGLVITAAYILLQAAMYVYSFASFKTKLPWLLSIELFLKRNFLSVFLPAGGVTSLAYLPSSLRNTDIAKEDVHKASGMYAFIGFFSIFLVGVPVILYTLTQASYSKNALSGIVYMTMFLMAIAYVFYALKSKGWLYKLLIKYFPAAETRLLRFAEIKFTGKGFLQTTIASVGVEACGVFHLYIAMLALGLPPSFVAASVGYIISVILLFTSPFLRGLGAVEVSLTYILTLYGYSTAEALGITILYRIFEFWLPLVAGIVSFAAKGKKLFLRLLPAVLIFFLGAINIFSAITPPIGKRIFLLKQYVDNDFIHASTLLTMLVGLILIITATFLIRGLKAAWVIALSFAGLSLIMNLTKALDWEEASLSLITIIILISTYKQYRLKSSRSLMNLGVITAIIVFITVVFFETLGFYYLDKRHFNIDFTWAQSFKQAIRTFLLVTKDDLIPITRFAKDFITGIYTLSIGTWLFLFFTIFKAAKPKVESKEKDRKIAANLLEAYGSSAVDYFKLAEDKIYFFSENFEGFVAYRVASGFAVVLDEPVCAEEHKVFVLKEFEVECSRLGLKSAYYRVDAQSLYFFTPLKKRKLFIGQEAVLELSKFTLEGKDKKSMRNGLNSLAKKGYKTVMHEAPQSGALLQQLKAVSDEWLVNFDKKESVFSQGMFDAAELKQHHIIAIYDEEERVVAFLNIIPDFTPDGITYDMIRKTTDAPGGAMDALIIELINYGNKKGIQWLNLGLAPLSGIDAPENTAERVVKFAYDKVKRFQHYQGLRDFKEKYASQWLNKYLIYDSDLDLVELPKALNKVMLPLKAIKK